MSYATSLQYWSCLEPYPHIMQSGLSHDWTNLSFWAVLHFWLVESRALVYFDTEKSWLILGCIFASIAIVTVQKYKEMCPISVKVLLEKNKMFLASILSVLRWDLGSKYTAKCSIQLGIVFDPISPHSLDQYTKSDDEKIFLLFQRSLQTNASSKV